LDTEGSPEFSSRLLINGEDHVRPVTGSKKKKIWKTGEVGVRGGKKLMLSVPRDTLFKPPNLGSINFRPYGEITEVVTTELAPEHTAGHTILPLSSPGTAELRSHGPPIFAPSTT